MNLKRYAAVLLVTFIPAVKGGLIAYGICQTGKMLSFCLILFVSLAVTHIDP